ncbi:unnamed protein product [Cylicocyclus nassatus]|uniref:Uncharacterized protein n=1 Tax=Cylicocyclus nassatus TaxID=53992 RepID=A0AA36H226_CYLNA|nr:unnamed protein product [Cylicocyclus nassatus]
MATKKVGCKFSKNGRIIQTFAYEKHRPTTNNSDVLHEDEPAEWLGREAIKFPGARRRSTIRRDIRSYTFDVDLGWTSAKKQSKKAAIEDGEASQCRGNSTSPEL